MNTRAIYHSLRRQHRIARRDLLGNPSSFQLCSEIMHSLREITGRWDVGTEKPDPYWFFRYKPGKRDYLFVSLSLTRWLKVNP